MWVYDHFKKFFPGKTQEHLVYFSNVFCISISEFHLTSTCSPPGMCAPVLALVVVAELPPLENYVHEEELESKDIRIRCIATIKLLRVWLHRVNMTTGCNEARANSPCSHDHKLGTLLDFLLMPENTGMGLRHIMDWVVAKNVDALEVCLVKSRKLLKEASKAQTKLLTHLMKQKMTLEKAHISKRTRDETREALSLTTMKLDQARTTITQHTTDITHIKSLLKDCESMDEGSSCSEKSTSLEPRAEDFPTATPQGHEEGDPHDIEMKDVGNDPNLPPPSEQANDLLLVPVQAAQSDPHSEDDEGQGGMRDDRDVIIKDKRIIDKVGDATQITMAEDQLLDDQVGTGAETPSAAVAELLSQMNVGLPIPSQEASDPPGQDA